MRHQDDPQSAATHEDGRRDDFIHGLAVNQLNRAVELRCKTAGRDFFPRGFMPNAELNAAFMEARRQGCGDLALDVVYHLLNYPFAPQGAALSRFQGRSATSSTAPISTVIVHGVTPSLVRRLAFL